MRARDNPFSTDRVAALRFRMSEDEWAGLITRWLARGQRGAVVGPHGSGKTRLLHELRRRLEAGGRHVRAARLGIDYGPSAGEWTALTDTSGPRDVVLLDGAGHLSRLGWWRLRLAARRAAGLLITLHHPGRLPTVHETRPTEELLFDLVRDLVGPDRAAALAPRCGELFRRHRGNLRECLRSLYDLHAEGGR